MYIKREWKRKEILTKRKDTYYCIVLFASGNKSIRVAVRFGEYDLTKEIDCQGNICADPVLVVGVQQKIPHQGYNENNINRANDIGLIRLNSEVTFTDYVRPICLSSSVNSPRTSPNQRFISAGWGRSSSTSKNFFIFFFFILRQNKAEQQQEQKKKKKKKKKRS